VDPGESGFNTAHFVISRKVKEVTGPKGQDGHLEIAYKL
jgi:hypothetical protein